MNCQKSVGVREAGRDGQGDRRQRECVLRRVAGYASSTGVGRVVSPRGRRRDGRGMPKGPAAAGGGKGGSRGTVAVGVGNAPRPPRRTGERSARAGELKCQLRAALAARRGSIWAVRPTTGRSYYSTGAVTAG